MECAIVSVAVETVLLVSEGKMRSGSVCSVVAEAMSTGLWSSVSMLVEAVLFVSEEGEAKSDVACWRTAEGLS